MTLPKRYIIKKVKQYHTGKLNSVGLGLRIANAESLSKTTKKVLSYKKMNWNLHGRYKTKLHMMLRF